MGGLLTGFSEIRLLLTPLGGPWPGVVVDYDSTWCLGESLGGMGVKKHLMFCVGDLGAGGGLGALHFVVTQCWAPIIRHSLIFFWEGLLLSHFPDEDTESQGSYVTCLWVCSQ